MMLKKLPLLYVALYIALNLIVGFAHADNLPNPIRLAPSGAQISVPDASVSFDDYVKQARAQIRRALTPLYQDGQSPFAGGYDIEKVINLRAPVALRPRANCPKDSVKKGFLVLHGLTDTNFSMSAVQKSLRANQPCAVIFAPILAGHGTVAGDSLNIRYQDWVEGTLYALNALKKEASDIYLIGFSTGGLLAVKYVAEHPDDKRIKGLVLFAPGFKTYSKLTFLTPLIRHVKDYLAIYPDKAPAKYESFSYPFAAEFYKLSRSVKMSRPIQVPSFIVATSDDRTVDSAVINRFFCKQIKAKRQMIWYQGEQKKLTRCDGIIIRKSRDIATDTAFINHSHLGLTLPPDDETVGIKGVYRHCLGYYVKQRDKYNACLKDDANVVYGEKNISDNEEILQGRLFRRVMFNPDYDAMIEAMLGFLDNISDR